MFSVAALEAFLNEFIDDVGFDRELSQLMDPRRQSVLNRYYYFFKLDGKPTFDKGALPAQYVESLVKLRNALVHFVPVWDSVDQPRSVEKALPKLATSPFLGDNEVVFPMRCIGHSYAEWSVQTVYNCLEDFCRLAGHDFKLAKRKDDFRTV